MDRKHDIEKLVAAVRQLAPTIARSADEAWKQSPALCVIDCVLSLNRNYDGFVIPRLQEFGESRRVGKGARRAVPTFY